MSKAEREQRGERLPTRKQRIRFVKLLLDAANMAWRPGAGTVILDQLDHGLNMFAEAGSNHGINLADIGVEFERSAEFGTVLDTEALATAWVAIVFPPAPPYPPRKPVTAPQPQTA